MKTPALTEEQLAEFESEIQDSGLDHRDHIRFVLRLVHEVRKTLPKAPATEEK